MITANELRIGNYIHQNGKIINIGSLQSNFYGVSINNIGIDTGIFTPIVITEGWLLKFGGKKTDMGVLLELQRGHTMSLNILLKSCIMSISGPFGLVTPCHIKHVHQLQNLYFALTGTELEVVNEN